MKLYSRAPGASISMGADSGLAAALTAAFRESKKPLFILETGTYEGLGSTTLIAEAVAAADAPCRFITLEIDWRSWRKARRNLRRFPFVHAFWGASLRYSQALQFLRQDEVLRNHHQFPDVYIDDVDAPYDFYVNELRGSLSGLAFRHLPRREKLAYLASLTVHYRGEDLLARRLHRWRDCHPLVVLDSAGGVGWLEFQTMLAALGPRPFSVLLDDVHHLKHFRSRKYILGCPSFEVLHESPSHGTLLARYRPSASPATAPFRRELRA